MKNRNHNISDKAVALVENHSILASLLAVLCLVFAVNFFLTGPGSDGGSGLGGTGKFGGESGFGGTGKTPDSGFKLGSNDSDQDAQNNRASEYLIPSYSPADALDDELGLGREKVVAAMVPTPKPEFDVDALRLSPDMPVVPVNEEFPTEKIDVMVANVQLDIPAVAIDSALDDQRNVIVEDTLVASLDILNSLMLAESETALPLESAMVASAASGDNDSQSIRQRIAVPVRPERPDRFNMPGRVAPVQRANIPAPPPVRPMRTLSTLLNK